MYQNDRIRLNIGHRGETLFIIHLITFGAFMFMRNSYDKNIFAALSLHIKL